MAPKKLVHWCRRRAQLLAASAVLTALTFRQAPGDLLPDTKLDMALAPARFLGRALRMWQPEAAFGHIANQAVGYLAPMGPFFAVGDLLPVPMWVVQRTWAATLLVVACWGAVKVTEAMDAGTPVARVIGGVAYALSPTLIVLLGQNSGSQVPAAVLPWALLPLVRGATGGSPRRAAAASGLAIVAMGAVNAASTVAVLPLPLLWLVTRQRGRRRTALLGWWLGAVAVASLWWLVPLLLQGRYGLDFLVFTEQAGTTTATASAVETMRGMGHWLLYFFVAGPWLPGGWALASSQVAVGATVVLTAVGIYGVTRRDAPERTFLVLAVVLGTIAATAGYAGPLGGAFSGGVRDLLDGPLGAFRNVQKFAPVLRLPLAIGLVHALSRVRWEVGPVERAVRVGVAAAVVGAAAWPLARGEVAPPGTFERIPADWRAAAAWLDRQPGGGRTLVLPASAFGEYTWGRPLDEPLQPLSRRRWAVRDLIPLGSSGATRLLDGVEARLARGEPSTGLAGVLARAGIRFVLVRHDLDPFHAPAPGAAHLRRALAGSPGLRLAAAFGPTAGSGLTTDRLPPDLGRAGRRQGFQAVEVYEVERPVAHAVAYPAGDAIVLSGGPEEVLRLADDGLLDGRAVILAGDRTGGLDPGVWVATDGLARRDVNFGGVRDNVSYPLTASELAPDTGQPPKDRLAVPGVEHQAVAVMTGVRAIRASSYGPGLVRVPEQQPAGAFDGDPATAWVASPFLSSRGQWIDVTLDRPRSVPTITLQLLRDHPWRTRVAQIRVSTDTASVSRQLADTEAPQTVRLPRGTTNRIRVTLTRVEGSSGAGIREIAIPGVGVDRRLAVPADQPGAADVYLLDRLHTDPYDSTRSDEERQLRRRLTVGGRGQRVTVTGTALPRPGPVLDRALAEPAAGLSVAVSSKWSGLPAFDGSQLLDGDPATAWVAGQDDGPFPTIELTWSGQRTIDRIQMRAAAGPVLRPTRMRLLSPGGERDVVFDPSGTATFAPVTAERLSLAVLDTDASAVGSAHGLITGPAVGLAELHIPALADLEPAPPAAEARIELPCGDGPALLVDGESVPTSATATRADLQYLRPVPFEACEPVVLPPGGHRVDSGPGGFLTLTSLALRAGDPSPPTAGGRRVNVGRWDAEHRTLSIGAGGRAVLAVDENFNAGWRARMGGSTLRPVRLDGWRQGFVVPAGAGGTVAMHFGPGRAYRAGLVAGALAVVALVGLAGLTGRGRHAATRARAPLDAVGPAELPGWVPYALGGATGLLVGGPMVAAVPVLVFIARARPARTAALAALLYAGAGAVAVVHNGRLPVSESGAFGPAAQALAVASLVTCAIALARPPPPSTPGARSARS